MAAGAESAVPHNQVDGGALVRLLQGKGRIPRRFLDGAAASPVACQVVFGAGAAAGGGAAAESLSFVPIPESAAAGAAGSSVMTSPAGKLRSGTAAAAGSPAAGKKGGGSKAAAGAPAAASDTLTVGLKYVTRHRPLPNPTARTFAASVSFLTPFASGTLTLQWNVKADRDDFLSHLRQACAPAAAQ